jgi:hypothetical protein
MSVLFGAIVVAIVRKTEPMHLMDLDAPVKHGAFVCKAEADKLDDRLT